MVRKNEMKALAQKKISDSLVRGKNEPPGAIFIHLFFFNDCRQIIVI